MPEEFPKVGLYQTQERSLFAHQVGREYQLAVFLPENYAASQQRYPVIYLLDGDLYIGMAASLTPLLNWLDHVPEMIVVGINYNMKGYDEWAQLRELDFKIPEVQDAPQDSHADRFLAALKQEIIPFIEDNYRVEPQARVLCGYSSSGFFALYALCHEPDLFRTYLAGSGDTELSSLYLPAHDQKLVSRQKEPPIDLYLSVGSVEEGSQSSLVTFNTLVAAIHDRHYAGVRLITEVYEGEKHGAAGAALTYIRGLQKCFPTVK
jgi:predicted alpha/beta superfamily hydrolase